MITEQMLASLSIQERKNLRKQYILSKNLDGLLSLAVFRFKNGGMATHEFDIPEMAYFFGRKNDAVSFNKLIKQYVGPFLFTYPESCIEMAKYLFTIGRYFPNISDGDIDYIEELYLNPKFYNMMDAILFDKEKLPRILKHFDAESLQITHTEFSDDFLDRIFHCFVENQDIEDMEREEEQPMSFYDRPRNRIIRKMYEDRCKGEFCIDFKFNCRDFHRFVADKYGQDFAERFARSMNFVPNTSWQEFMDATYYWPRIENIEETAEFLFEEKKDILTLERQLAKMFLEKCNAVKLSI